jgi:hypothetical protein
MIYRSKRRGSYVKVVGLRSSGLLLVFYINTFRSWPSMFFLPIFMYNSRPNITLLLTQRTTFEDKESRYLIPNVIRSLTECDPLEAIIDQDRLLQCRSHDGEMTSVEEVFLNTTKLFILTLKLGQSVNFLFDLHGSVWAEDLPIQKDAVIELTMDQESEVDKLLANQAIVCAPILVTDKFNQEVPFESSILSRAVEQVNGIDTYFVEFHSEYIRHLYSGHAGKYKMYVDYSRDDEEAKRQRNDYK